MNKQSLTNCIRVAALAALAAIPGLSCTYSVSVPAIPASGGVVYVYVSTQAGCPWQVTHNGSFLSNYSGWSGTGPGTALLYAQPDRGAARSATVSALEPYQSGCQLGGRSCIPTFSYRTAAAATAIQY